MPAPLTRFGPDAINVLALGTREWIARGQCDRPRGLECWLVMAFHHPVTLGTSAGPVAVPADTTMIWPPSSPQLYGNPRRHWSHSWLHLAGAGMDRLIALCGITPHVPISGVPSAMVEARIGDIHHEISAQMHPDPMLVELSIHLLLRTLARGHARTAGLIPPGLLNARRHLERSFAHPLRLDDLAAIAGLSRNHFCTSFHRLFGASPYGFMLRLRLERARTLLYDRNRPIASIAAEVGYDDPASFYRLMRRRLGVSPRSLRDLRA